MLNVIQMLSDISFFDKMFISILSVVAFVQVFYWLRYSRILNKFFQSKEVNVTLPSVSVIVVVNESHLEWINGDMRELFFQNHPNYEVVVVNDCGGLDVSSALQYLCSLNPILKYTTILPDKKYSHTKKVALLVGIKKASFDNFIFVDPWTKPSSVNWLKNMSEGFLNDKDIVIGASSVSVTKGMSYIIRPFNLMSLIRYFSSAVRKRPYRASKTNYGFTRKIFFENHGYNFLSSSYGTNDLFLQKIFKKDNYSVVVGNECLIISTCQSSFRKWFKDEMFSTSSFRFYPVKVKLSIFFELFSSFSISAMLIASLVKVAYFDIRSYFFEVNVLFFVVILLTLLLLHQFILLFVVSKLANKLDMKKVLFGFMRYVIIAPFFEFFLSINRRFGDPKKLW